MQVRKYVYYNLHKNIWSVKDIKTGRVNGDHRGAILLTDCKLKVSESGRKRVLEQKRKNVHAGVDGIELNYKWAHSVGSKFIDLNGTLCHLREITYNPYKYDSFVYKDNERKVTFAKRIFMIGKKVYEVLPC